MADARFTLPKGAKTALYRVAISVSHTGLRAVPKPSAFLQSELLFGQEFDVYEDLGTALLGRVRPLLKGQKRPGYVGYISKSAVTREVVNSTHVVTSVCAPIFRKADIKSTVRIALPLNARIHAGSVDDNFAKIAGLGYIHKAHCRSLVDAAPEDFVDIAEKYIGRPYVWGGTGGVGLDCSALVQMSLAACGIDAPRDADQQEIHLGQPVTNGNLQRGDLVFWPGHVGIMESATGFLHANAYHMETAREPYKKAAQRIGPPRIIKRP